MTQATWASPPAPRQHRAAKALAGGEGLSQAGKKKTLLNTIPRGIRLIINLRNMIGDQPCSQAHQNLGVRSAAWMTRWSLSLPVRLEDKADHAQMVLRHRLCDCRSTFTTGSQDRRRSIISLPATPLCDCNAPLSSGARGFRRARDAVSGLGSVWFLPGLTLSASHAVCSRTAYRVTSFPNSSE